MCAPGLGPLELWPPCLLVPQVPTECPLECRIVPQTDEIPALGGLTYIGYGDPGLSLGRASVLSPGVGTGSICTSVLRSSISCEQATLKPGASRCELRPLVAVTARLSKPWSGARAALPLALEGHGPSVIPATRLGTPTVLLLNGAVFVLPFSPNQSVPRFPHL